MGCYGGRGGGGKAIIIQKNIDEQCYGGAEATLRAQTAQ